MGEIKFGTGGFRAVIGDDFNKDNVEKICQAICNIIIKKKLKKQVCIGYDNRFMSENFARWCSEVFAANKIDVELLDCAVSTPVVMYATMKNENDYGIMITASHNPHIYNGVKVIVKGGKDADVTQTEEIEKEILILKNIKKFKFEYEKYIDLINFNNDYINNIVNLLKLKNCAKNLKIVFDVKHGSTVSEINNFTKKIGCKNVQIINAKRDAFFDFIAPAPNEDNVSELKNVVLNSNADIGFALDADGDRLAVIDENGKFIDNNYILAISYYFLVKYCKKKGDAIKNIATSNLLDIVCEKLGFNCHEVPVGFKHIYKGILDKNAVIGGESSGGLAISGHVGGKDSLIAIAICLKAMSVMQKSFGEILKEVIDFAGKYKKVIMDKQYCYTTEQKQKIFAIIKSKKTPVHRFELDKIDYKDYVKIYYKNKNWVLIRFSGTEPILRIYVESDTKQECEQLILDWEKFLDL